MRILLSLLAVVLMLGLGSCKKDSKDPAACSAYWATELEAELNAVMTTGMAYSTEQTSENCNAYKEAYLDFLDALRPYAECTAYTTEERQEILDAIEEGEADIEDLNCDTK